MSRPTSHAQLRSLAYRCEHAKHKRCNCRCHGTLHGQQHGEEWIADEVMRDQVRHQLEPSQIDWVGYAGFEQYL